MSITKGVALITGSAQGIGRAVALRLTRDGFDIALNDVSSKRDQLRTVANDIDKIGQRTHLVPADVSVECEVKGMVQDTTKRLGGLDVMVANAGICALHDFASAELDEWERIMAVNARGTFLCYKYAAAQMIAQGRGGRIIGASSVAGKLGQRLSSAYTASKFAVRGLTQTAALEFGRHNITVNSYAPGVIETPMSISLSKGLDTLDKEMAELVLNVVSEKPIKHVGQPEDIASIVSYLASKEAHFITGRTMCKLSNRTLATRSRNCVWYSTNFEQISVDGGVVMS